MHWNRGEAAARFGLVFHSKPHKNRLFRLPREPVFVRSRWLRAPWRLLEKRPTFGYFALFLPIFELFHRFLKMQIIASNPFVNRDFARFIMAQNSRISNRLCPSLKILAKCPKLALPKTTNLVFAFINVHGCWFQDAKVFTTVDWFANCNCRFAKQDQGEMNQSEYSTLNIKI